MDTTDGIVHINASMSLGKINVGKAIVLTLVFVAHYKTLNIFRSEFQLIGMLLDVQFSQSGAFYLLSLYINVSEHKGQKSKGGKKGGNFLHLKFC